MIVVCGDSFYFDDADYPNIHWTSKFTNLTNLAMPGASNLVIRMQIDRAISLNPDLVVVSFTSCLRTVIKYKNHSTEKNLLDRLYVPKSNLDYDLISFPYAGAKYFNQISNHQLDILNRYAAEFVDLDLLRQENYYLVKDALETLLQSGVKFVFSLGGFDHKTFCDQSPYDFSKYEKFNLPINLWDHWNKTESLRPWFHVTDKQIQNDLAEFIKNV